MLLTIFLKLSKSANLRNVTYIILLCIGSKYLPAYYYNFYTFKIKTHRVNTKPV